MRGSGGNLPNDTSKKVRPNPHHQLLNARPVFLWVSLLSIKCSRAFTQSCREPPSARTVSSMALRYSQTLPAVVLLILAIVGILLVVHPAKNMETPPEYMVMKIIIIGYASSYNWQVTCIVFFKRCRLFYCIIITLIKFVFSHTVSSRFN